MKANSVKTWEKTRLQNLVRHKSGRYYARLFLNGKEIWKSLKTSHFSVAESRLAVAQKEHRERKGREVDPANAKMTFGQAASLHMQRLEERVDIKRRTRAYWKETLAALIRSWPELPGMEVRRITQAACRDWAARYAKVASSSRYNNSLSLLRHVLDVAIESGVLYANPATGMERKSIRPKKLELPTRAQFAAFITEIRAAHSRDTQNCADFAQGLAFTGCRISEAAQIEWRDLDFAGGEILVKGDPEEATKNGEIRRVPMIQTYAPAEDGRTGHVQSFPRAGMPEGNGSRRQENRHGKNHASRFAAFFCNRQHRKRCGYSHCFPLAWTQGRRGARNENLRASSPGTQRSPSAESFLRCLVALCQAGEGGSTRVRFANLGTVKFLNVTAVRHRLYLPTLIDELSPGIKPSFLF
jgi:integrase